MRVFFDSSALAKRYLEEAGKERVATLCQEADEIVLSVLCVPEVVSGLARLRREGNISGADYRSLKGSLAADIEDATTIDLTPSVIDRAIGCLEQAPLRTLDAVHIASAMEAQCDLFVTADERQYRAALSLHLRAESLVVARQRRGRP